MRLALIAMSVVLLCGCGAPLKIHPLDSAGSLETLAILPIHHEDRFVYEYARDQLESLNALAPGPLGSALSAVAGAQQRSGYNQATRLDFGFYVDHASQAIERSVRVAGFNVVDVAADIEGMEGEDFVERLPDSLWEQTDAVLETRLDVGSVAAGRGGQWRPVAWIWLRLTSAEGVLLQDRILFNALTSDEGDFITLTGIRLHVPPRFEFEDADALLGAEKADAALRYAIDRAAAEVAFLLRGPWL